MWNIQSYKMTAYSIFVYSIINNNMITKLFPKLD